MVKKLIYFSIFALISFSSSSKELKITNVKSINGLFTSYVKTTNSSILCEVRHPRIKTSSDSFAYSHEIGHCYFADFYYNRGLSNAVNSFHLKYRNFNIKQKLLVYAELYADLYALNELRSNSSDMLTYIRRKRSFTVSFPHSGVSPYLNLVTPLSIQNKSTEELFSDIVSEIDGINF